MVTPTVKNSSAQKIVNFFIFFNFIYFNLYKAKAR